MIFEKTGIISLLFTPSLNFISKLTLRLLSLPGLSEVGEEEEPAPFLVANREQGSILLTRLLKDCFQTPAR